MIPSEPRNESRAAALDFGRYAGLGLQFVVTLALFGALGWWLDERLGWSPWLLVAGVLAGAVVAFVTVVRSVPKPSSRSPSSSSSSSSSKPPGARPPAGRTPTPPDAS